MLTSVFMFLALLGGGPEPTADLFVAIPNLKEAKGEVVIAIYDQVESFPKVGQTYRTVRFKVRSTSDTYMIRGVKTGECALAIYHDENSDGQCNSNLLGIPREGYGFSNNVRPVFSAPPYEACKIYLPGDMRISVRMIY